MRWDVRTLRFYTGYTAGLHAAFDQEGAALLGLRPGSLVAERIKEGIPLDETVRLLSAASVGFVLAYDALQHPFLTEVASLPGESSPITRLFALSPRAPRARMIFRASLVPGPWDAIDAIRTGRADPLSEVVLLASDAGGDVGDAESGDAPAGTMVGSAAIARDDPEEVVVAVGTPAQGWLVLTDTYDDWWRAEVDGRAAPVLRANGLFRAVKVPAGSHEVRFVYSPKPFLWGGILGVLGLVCVIVLLATGRRHREEAARAGGLAA